MRAVLATFVATALQAAPVFAQEDQTQGLYFGVGLGDFSTGTYEIAGADAANLDFDSDETANKIFAGWRFNRLVAVQVDHVGFERSIRSRDAPSVIATETEGFAPSLVGTLPLGPLEFFARAGIFWYDLDIERNGTSFSDDSDRDPIFGAGIGFTVARRVNLRAEYEVVEIDGLDDPNAVWVTAAWRF
jgi:hypothetical protein